MGMTTRMKATFYVLTAIALLAFAVLRGNLLSSNHAAAVGMMPEVVVSAPLPNMIVDTIVVRPTGPSLVAGTTPDRSELN